MKKRKRQTELPQDPQRERRSKLLRTTLAALSQQWESRLSALEDASRTLVELLSNSSKELTQLSSQLAGWNKRLAQLESKVSSLPSREEIESIRGKLEQRAKFEASLARSLNMLISTLRK